MTHVCCLLPFPLYSSAPAHQFSFNFVLSLTFSFHLSVPNYYPSSLPYIFSGLHFNHCFSEIESFICPQVFLIPSYLSLLPFFPFFLPTMGTGQMHVELVVFALSCEGDLPDDRASSSETVSSQLFKGFAKPLKKVLSSR